MQRKAKEILQELARDGERLKKQFWRIDRIKADLGKQCSINSKKIGEYLERRIDEWCVVNNSRSLFY